jgi:mono/diheme cytochrome c family protein
VNGALSKTLGSTVVAGLLVLASADDARAQSSPDGAGLFRTYCASCHGATARGTGPVAIFLRVAPADLTQIAKRNRGVFPADQVYRIIDGRQSVKTHGDSRMPVWGDAFLKAMPGADEKAIGERIRALVAFLESIQERPAN